MQFPAISVLMPVYNGAPFLREAIDSILDQTFAHFELIIVNDQSTDASESILTRYSDPRIRVVKNAVRSGVARALNEGLRIVRGQYIARMDADDICHRKRLSRQFAFMERHPEVVLCGTRITTFPSNQPFPFVQTDAEIRTQMLFFCPIVHPTVFIRRQPLHDHGLQYDPNFVSEDYDLWQRLSRVGQIVNLTCVGLRYRIHEKQISYAQRALLNAYGAKVRRRVLEDLGIKLAEPEALLHEQISLLLERPKPGFLENSLQWLRRIESANQNSRFFAESDLRQTLLDRWLWLVYKTSGPAEFLRHCFRKPPFPASRTRVLWRRFPYWSSLWRKRKGMPPPETSEKPDAAPQVN